MRHLAFVLALAIASFAQGTSPSPAIATDTLPRATLHQNFFFEFKANGVGPAAWEVLKGSLPPGLALERSTGRLAGIPNETGEFRFTIGVADNSNPPRAAAREFVLRVVAALTLRWTLYPQVVNNNAIRGSVVVANGTRDAVDLTFISVAVNEIGKAFALGYQHFTLAPDSESPQLELSSTLPAGSYVVHVDAVAEVPARNLIHRARLQTQNTLSLTGLP